MVVRLNAWKERAYFILPNMLNFFMLSSFSKTRYTFESVLDYDITLLRFLWLREHCKLSFLHKFKSLTTFDNLEQVHYSFHCPNNSTAISLLSVICGKDQSVGSIQIFRQIIEPFFIGPQFSTMFLKGPLLSVVVGLQPFCHQWSSFAQFNFLLVT